MTGRNVVVAGGFSAIPSRTIRFLEEASRLGNLHVLLWAEESDSGPPGGSVKLTLPERHYILLHNRYVSTVTVTEDGAGRSELPLHTGMRPDVWAVEESDDPDSRRVFCRAHGIEYRVIRSAELQGFPSVPPPSRNSGRRKVVVTGCFDWFHSGHVRFFEEASAYGDLYVVVGSDSNLRLLKGEGHPLFPQEERRYVVQSVRFVVQALISTGTGWMDAEPEIERIRPDIYLVNEDGDQPEKREFCRQRGLEYVVLKREPKPGLPRRQSTDLRGF
jgi:cytidyltransferase-like protein